MFAGSAAFISFCVMPATHELNATTEGAVVSTPTTMLQLNAEPLSGTGVTLPFFQHIYPKAAAIQAPLALVSAATSLAAFWSGEVKVSDRFDVAVASRSPWLLAGALMVRDSSLVALQPYCLSIRVASFRTRTRA